MNLKSIYLRLQKNKRKVKNSKKFKGLKKKIKVRTYNSKKIKIKILQNKVDCES